MARTDDDTWEITESVGATALGVASARAVETESENPMISDPFARVFLDAAGDGLWNWYSASQLPAEILEAEPSLQLQMKAMVGYMACRTAFFDEFFLDATNAGIRQAVILASGLDSRAWRLAWPGGVTVYELDQPRVLEFKSSTLDEHGAQPAWSGSPVASVFVGSAMRTIFRRMPRSEMVRMADPTKIIMGRRGPLYRDRFGAVLTRRRPACGRPRA